VNLAAPQRHLLTWVYEMGGWCCAGLSEDDDAIAQELAGLGLLERGTRTAGRRVATWELTEAGRGAATRSSRAAPSSMNGQSCWPSDVN
jgi:hypothetical protein